MAARNIVFFVIAGGAFVFAASAAVLALIGEPAGTPAARTGPDLQPAVDDGSAGQAVSARQTFRTGQHATT